MVLKKKVPEEYRADYRKVKRVLSTIKKTGWWHKATDLTTVQVLDKKGYIKYVGKGGKHYKITPKGENFLKGLKNLLK